MTLYTKVEGRCCDLCGNGGLALCVSEGGEKQRDGITPYMYCRNCTESFKIAEDHDSTLSNVQVQGVVTDSPNEKEIKPFQTRTFEAVINRVVAASVTSYPETAVVIHPLLKVQYVDMRRCPNGVVAKSVLQIGYVRFTDGRGELLDIHAGSGLKWMRDVYHDTRPGLAEFELTEPK